MGLALAGPEVSTGCWFFTGNQRMLAGHSQWVKLSQAHLLGTPYSCLSSILCHHDSKENSVGALDRKLDPHALGLSPQVGSLLMDPHHCMVPTSSPLCFSFLSWNFLSSFKQENWLLYQHSFFQSYCLTYCLCQEFQKVYFETKSRELILLFSVPCDLAPLWPGLPGCCLSWVEGNGPGGDGGTGDESEIL